MLAADAFEQHAVYLINLDRNEQSLPPFVIEDRLVNAAGAKSADLRNCFDHVCDGKGPSVWASEAGYNSNVAEVLVSYFPPGSSNSQAKQALEGWIDSPTHRDILRGDNNEVGVGRTTVGNNVYWAGLTGSSKPNATYLTGVVFDDRNDNRRYDYGEGLSGVTVSDGMNSVTTTPAGGWKLEVAPNKAHTITANGGGFGPDTTTLVEVANENRSLDFAKGWNSVNLDYGTHPAERAASTPPTSNPTRPPQTEPDPVTPNPASGKGFVSGRVFIDIDENGERTSDEVSLANWIVFVDANNNGKRDKGESQQLTDADGRYEFQLAAKTRAVKVRTELKNGFNKTTSLGKSVVIQTGVRKTKDFGVLRNNEISGFVFQDADRDGMRDAKEKKLSGWTVFVDANSNGRRDAGERQDVTNKNGKYSFKSLEPGSHKIVVAGKSGFEFTSRDTRSVSVRSSGAKTEKNFGVNQPRETTARPPRSATISKAMISGKVFEDANGDGLRSTNEELLAGWIVFVDSNRNGARDANETFARTDQNGRYEFTLPVGSYRIGAETRGGFAFTTNQVRSVSIRDGVSKRQRDFGVMRPSAAIASDAAIPDDFATLRDASNRDSILGDSINEIGKQKNGSQRLGAVDRLFAKFR